tara:strand:+ start:18627 stop:18776 length:150 start_codon:yes stop_codon:yes gene_type:complete
MTDDDSISDDTVQGLIDLMGELETVEEMAFQLRKRIADLTMAVTRTTRH